MCILNQPFKWCLQGDLVISEQSFKLARPQRQGVESCCQILSRPGSGKHSSRKVYGVTDPYSFILNF